MYKAKTYNLLNYFTLQIKDPEIRSNFNSDRCEHFYELFKPVAFSVGLLFLLRLGLYFQDRE